MDARTFHLAMAALLGASFAGASAYYVQRKILTQVLEELDRAAASDYDDDDAEIDSEQLRLRPPPPSSNRRAHQGHQHKAPGYRRGGAGTDRKEAEYEKKEKRVPQRQTRRRGRAMNVTSPASAAEADDGHRSFPIPLGLPPVQVVQEGTYGSFFSVFSPE